MAKPILNKARAEQNLAKQSIESNVKYELGEELLKELRSNTYSERVEEDVVGHIAKILEILDLIKIAGVDPFQLCMMTFPLSFSGDFKNQGRNDRNKRQRTGRSFSITALKQGQVQCQYAGQHPKCAKCNFHHSGGNRPNPMLAIKGNHNQGNNRNQARGKAFAIGDAEAPQDPNIVTARSSLKKSSESEETTRSQPEAKSRVWICQISQEISQKRTRERMSDQEAKDLKAEAREIMPQPSTTVKPRVWLDKEPPDQFSHGTTVTKFINQTIPPSKTTYYRNEIITFYQKPNEAFNEAWERFKGLLRQCPHHGFSELHQLDTFYNSLNSNDQDALDSAAGGNFLDKMPQEGLAIIESKSKVRYSRSRANDSRVSTDAPLSNSSSSNNSFDMQQIAASLEDKMTIKMNQMMSQMKALVVTTPAPVKAVEEVCVTCGSNHNFNHCPLTRGGNDFPVFQDNIQQFQQTAAVGNFLQPSNLASQMRPPGFNQPNVQTNQNRYQGTNSNFNQNRGGNFNQNRQNQVYQNPPYQTPTNQPPINQVLPYQPPTNSVLKTDFENYVKANDAVLKNVQNQGQNLQNQMANVTSLLTSLCENFKNPASTSNSGTLPSQTVTNPRQQINAITTRSGKTLEEPSIPLVPTPDVSKPQKEPEQNPETSTEKVQNPNLENTAHVPSPGEEDLIFMEIPNPKAKKTINVEIQDLNSPNPNSNQSRLPYPERMKVRGHDKPSAQYSRFLKMFKQLRLEIGLKDALVEMPKFNKWLSSLLRNKELEEIAITTVKCRITNALADSGASINLLPHSIYKKLGLEALTPTRITLELATSSTDELAPLLNSGTAGNDDSTLKKEFHEVNFRELLKSLSNSMTRFRSSNVNPLFEENNKDVEIKSSFSSTPTSPEASELEDYLEKINSTRE
ncbi:reverse transcriptase domain-containing protein [Tanacetum coccineum]